MLSAPTRLRLPLSAPQTVEATALWHWTPVGEVDDPLRPAVVLAHGAGSGPDSDVLVAVCSALARSGHHAVTFTFGYREAGRRNPDPPALLRGAWRDAVRWAQANLGKGRPLLLGGHSMGGRYASLIAAEDSLADAAQNGAAAGACAGLVLLSYPLTPGRRDAAAAAVRRAAHWPALRTVPTLFVAGDRDPLCDLDQLQTSRELLEGRSTLHVVRGGDHSLAVRRRDGGSRDEILNEVATTVTSWVGVSAKTCSANERCP